jgi:hypothetical protein
MLHFSTSLSGCTFFSSRAALSATRCPPLAHNGAAAWRRGGFHKCSCGRQKFNSAQNFPRGYCPPCAKPLVMCWHLSRVLSVSLHCRAILRFRVIPNRYHSAFNIHLNPVIDFTVSLSVKREFTA